MADYLRFVFLFREGGVYTDMDSILVRPVDQTNIIGVEHCDGDNLDYCIHLPQFDKIKRYYLPIGMYKCGIVVSESVTNTNKRISGVGACTSTDI